MKKRMIALICLICLVISASGCKLSLKDTIEGKDTNLPAFDLSSDLIGTITKVNGNLCTVTVLEDNAHYDKDRVVFITYDPDTLGNTLAVGDIILTNYNYITDVSAIDGTPHIKSSNVSVLPEYIPPETTAETESTEST